MGISVTVKKNALKNRILNFPGKTILKEEVDAWDTEMFGDVVINGNTKNAVKTHVSEVLEELEKDGTHFRTSIPSRKGNGHKQLLLVKVA